MSVNSRSFHFWRYGIVLHFVQKLGNERRRSAARDPLNPFDSFSEDLLSYRYSSRAGTELPIESKVEPLEPWEESVELSIPGAIEYAAEGATKTLTLPPRNGDADGESRLRRVAVKASRTTFTSEYAVTNEDSGTSDDSATSEYSVCHLAFVNPPESQREDDFLDEYDIVALSELWQRGERSELADKIRIRVREKERPKVGEFAEAIFGPLEGGANKVRVGTIQLITASEASAADDSTSPAADWEEIWKAVQDLVEDQPAAKSVRKQLIALGGIVAGILDFREIDDAELSDVFKPHARLIDETSLAGIHKGTLVCVMESDRSYDVVAEKIGVSPYLLLPQAALLHNEALLDDATKHANNVENENDPEKLKDCVKSMREQLRLQVPNVFHYPYEQHLFDEGERTRSLTARRMELTERLSGIENRWNVASTKRLERPVKILGGLFGFLAFAELLSWTNQAFHVQQRRWAWVEAGFLALALLGVGLIYWWYVGEPRWTARLKRHMRPTRPSRSR